MPIQVVWDNDDQTVIRYIIEGKWTWGEMLAAVAASNAMLDAAEGKVDFIHDMSASAGIPGGALSNLKRFIGKEHPRTGQSVIVSGGRSTSVLFAQGLLNIVDKIYKRDWGFHFADSLEQARQYLAQRAGQNDTP